MKKFEFTILIGKKIIYQSIISFTKEQEEVYLQNTVLEGLNEIRGELQVVIERSIGRKKYTKDFEIFENMTIEEYKRQYPEMLICAAIQESIYDTGLFSEFEPFRHRFESMFSFGSEEKVVDELENYTWKCVYINP